VSRLADGPLPVGQLAAELPITRSGVSQHLQILKHAGLVSEHASGTRRIYRLNSSALATLRDQLDILWRRSIKGDPDAATQEAEGA
jgi:DNA-binding transcriptional ArsR family regulator